MEWQEALDLVVSRTGHSRYRTLCAAENPDCEVHRRRVIEKSLAPGREAYPPLATQMGNAARALGRVVTAAVQGEPIRASSEERDRRQAICGACEHYDRAQARCRKCGCGSLKLELATEHCPLDPPRW